MDYITVRYVTSKFAMFHDVMISPEKFQNGLFEYWRQGSGPALNIGQTQIYLFDMREDVMYDDSYIGQYHLSRSYDSWYSIMAEYGIEEYN
ncbi:MAG: hypothetical protein HeimC3_03120 [Candidatus Heimdallarchaeota archaeon LC_3]|nr:MAG: hypothetical protein HeimC3_03120 [Candidatus Heimdallarchaeota archaeon LC_3]